MRYLLGLLLPLTLCACSNRTATTSAGLLAGTDTSRFIPLTEAVAKATERQPGFVSGALLEVEDADEVEPPAYAVLVFDPASATLFEVEVHAETGEVLEVEAADAEESDDSSAGGAR